MSTSAPSPVLVAAIGALVLLQLSLQITALVQLSRAPKERVSLDGRKWLWAVIIVLGELVGAIAWFFAGRGPEPVDTHSEPGASAGSSAVEELYGNKEEPR